jgi:hypothetical protein
LLNSSSIVICVDSLRRACGVGMSTPASRTSTRYPAFTSRLIMMPPPEPVPTTMKSNSLFPGEPRASWGPRAAPSAAPPVAVISFRRVIRCSRPFMAASFMQDAPSQYTPLAIDMLELLGYSSLTLP